MKRTISILLIVILFLGFSFAINSTETTGKGKVAISGEITNITVEDPSATNTEKDYVSRYQDSTLGVMYGMSNRLDVGLEHTGRVIQAYQNDMPSDFSSIGFIGGYNFIAKLNMGKICPMADSNALELKTTLVPMTLSVAVQGADNPTDKLYATSLTFSSSKKLAPRTTLGWGLGAMTSRAVKGDENGVAKIATPLSALIYTVGVDQDITKDLVAYLTLSGKLNSSQVGQTVSNTKGDERKLQKDSNVAITLGLEYTI